MAKIQKDHSKQDLVDQFNNTFRYLDEILALNNPDFQEIAKEMYPKELTLNKSNISNVHAPVLELDLTIEQGCLSTKLNICFECCMTG